MSYDPNIPISGSQITAEPLQTNFDQGPNTIKHDLIISGNSLTLGVGSGSLSWDSGNSRFKFDEGLRIDDYLNVNGYVMGSNLMAKADVHVNSDFTSGGPSAVIFFDAQTQWLMFDRTEGQFEFTENIHSEGTTIKVGDGANTSYYYLFDHGLGTAGLMVNDSGVCLFKNATGAWTVFGDASGNQDYNSVLGLGNTARGYDTYVRDVYSQPTALNNYVKMGADAYPNAPTIMFASHNAAGMGMTGSIFYNVVNDSFYMTKSLRLIGNGYHGFYAENIYSTDGSTDSTSNIYFGPIGNATYIEAYSDSGGVANSILRIECGEINTPATIHASGSVKANSHVYANANYSSGDEDALYYFNGEKESLRWNYGEDRFEFSDNLYASGHIEAASSGSQFNTLTTINNLQVGGHLYVSSGSTLFIPGSVGESNPGIVFASPGGILEGHNFYFDVINSRFKLDNNTFVNGILYNAANDIYIGASYSSANVDVAIYFGGGPSETLHWNHTDTRFEFSDDVQVTGWFKSTQDLMSNAMVYANASGNAASADATYNFCGTNTETLKWDYGSGSFRFSDDLGINTDVAGGGVIMQDATNGNQYKLDINNGTVRVTQV